MRALRMRARWLVTVAVASLVAGIVVLVVDGSPVSAASSAPGSFTSLPPARVLDTRSGLGGTAHPLAAGQSLTVQVGGQSGVPASGVASVVLHVTATQPTAAGFLTVWDGGARPNVSNLNFSTGETVGNLVVAPVSSTGQFSVFNGGGAGAVQVIADVSGYYLNGSAQAAGMYAPLTPKRLLDTRSGVGAAQQPLAAGTTLRFPVAGQGGVPASGVSAVVLNVTATQPTATGYITAWGDDPRPTAASLNFNQRQTIANLVVVPVSAGGSVALFNGAQAGSVHVIADVFGYILTGGPTQTGGLGAVPPFRMLDTRNGIGVAKAAVPSHQSVRLTVGGKGWVLPTGVSAVVLNLAATQPTAAGYVTAWAGGGAPPTIASLNFARGQTVGNLAVVPVASDGSVTFYNGALSGTVQLIADVAGFVLGADRTPQPPQVSPGRYVRNISDGGSADVTTMHNEGCADAQSSTGAGPYLTLLHLGAQSQHAPLSKQHPGVALTGFSEADTPRLTYPQLVTALEGYLDGYVSCRTGSATVTVAFGTNNDGDWQTYTAPEKGTDWATQVIEPLRSHVAADSWLNVAGADDIEAGFSSTEAQAEQWVTAFLGNTSASLVQDGSADACPTTFQTGGPVACGAVTDDNGVTKTWTQADYIRLEHGLSPGRIISLPQIYIPLQAWQWANIAFASGGQLTLTAALTEHAADTGQFTPQQGWSALWDAMSANAAVHLTAPQIATDLRSDWPATSLAVRNQKATLPNG